MEWFVVHENINKRKFERINILKYHEDYIKKLKKKAKSYVEFCEKLRSEMMYRYWSKCEAEVVITKKDGRIIMTPWVGQKDDIELDVTDNENFDWISFYDWIADKKRTWDGSIKIDIFDQLQYHWDEFAEYCFLYPHKYQRQTERDRLAAMYANK